MADTKFQPPQKKIKVVAYCDSPTCATGFGTVSRNILSGLYMTGKYDRIISLEISINCSPVSTSEKAIIRQPSKTDRKPHMKEEK